MSVTALIRMLPGHSTAALSRWARLAASRLDLASAGLRLCERLAAGSLKSSRSFAIWCQRSEQVLIGEPMTTQAREQTGRWVLLATITASSMAFIDSTALNVALNALQLDFKATGAE